MLRTCIRQDFLTAAARELVRYNLYLACMHEVKWDNGGTVRAGDYNIFCEKGNEKYYL